MGHTDLPDDDVWKQYDRIARHPLFRGSENLKGFLKHLISMRLSGIEDRDQYRNKLLSDVYFGTTSSLAKVEGLKIRERLREYYDCDGVFDPIIIDIPARRLRPDISPNAHLAAPLSAEAIRYIAQARSIFESGGYTWAYERLDWALAESPDHPRLLGILASMLVETTLSFTGPSRKLFEAAEHLLSEMKISTWEGVYASAAIAAARRKWDDADRLFNLANRLSKGESRFRDWYRRFLIARGRKTEALSILEDDAARHPHPSGSHFVRLAWDYYTLGDCEHAKEFLALASTLGDVDPGPFNEVHDFLSEVDGNFPEAFHSVINRIDSNNPDKLLVGYAACFAGLYGDAETALQYIDQLKILDQHGNYGWGPSSYLVAIAHIGLDADEAMKWLTKAAIEDIKPIGLLYTTLPLLRHLRHRDDFAALVATLNLDTLT